MTKSATSKRFVSFIILCRLTVHDVAKYTLCEISDFKALSKLPSKATSFYDYHDREDRQHVKSIRPINPIVYAMAYFLRNLRKTDTKATIVSHIFHFSALALHSLNWLTSIIGLKTKEGQKAPDPEGFPIEPILHPVVSLLFVQNI